MGRKRKSLQDKKKEIINYLESLRKAYLDSEFNFLEHPVRIEWKQVYTVAFIAFSFTLIANWIDGLFYKGIEINILVVLGIIFILLLFYVVKLVCKKYFCNN